MPSIKRLIACIAITIFMLTSTAQAQTCRTDTIPESAPSSRFEINGDGTVTDKITGLMWKRCIEGKIGSDCWSGSEARMNWQQALAHGEAHTFAEYSDWRVPNIKELDSIVERACYSPAINLEVFPNTPNEFIWSSSPYANDSDLAWVLVFGSGGHHSGYKYRHYGVRLVRGGQ